MLLCSIENFLESFKTFILENQVIYTTQSFHVTIEQLIFFWLKLSEAAPNTAISWTPTSRAFSNPFTLGTKTGYETPCFLVIPLKTSAWSPICGTHFGETKLVDSTTLSPESDNLWNEDLSYEKGCWVLVDKVDFSWSGNDSLFVLETVSRTDFNYFHKFGKNDIVLCDFILKNGSKICE